MNGPQSYHALRSLERPAHTREFQSIVDEIPACAFDDSASGITFKGGCNSRKAVGTAVQGVVDNDPDSLGGGCVEIVPDVDDFRARALQRCDVGDVRGMDGRGMQAAKIRGQLAIVDAALEEVL